MTLLLRLFGHIGTLGTLVSWIYMLNTGREVSIFWIGFLICLALVSFLVAIIFEYKLRPQDKGIYCKSEKEINNYMYNWIKNGGRVTIFTRDMSWAQKNPTIENMLHKKAKDDELSIILSEKNEFINGIEKSGAKIYTYGDLGYTPTSRFTIVKTDRIGSKVAIGSENEGEHYIEEFSSSNGYPFHIANDLSKFLIHYNDVMRGIKNDELPTSKIQERK